jgi:hypothetical protein
LVPAYLFTTYSIRRRYRRSSYHGHWRKAFHPYPSRAQVRAATLREFFGWPILIAPFIPLPPSSSVASRIRENFVGGQGIELDEADMALLNSMSLEGEESDEGRVALEWNPTNAL